MAKDFQVGSIAQFIEHQVEQTPDAIAIIDQQQQVTYRELNQRANQLAHFLVHQGVKPETLVGICVERSIEMVVALLGILKAGGAYVPLDPAYPQDRLAFTIADAEIPFLVTQTHLAAKVPASPATMLYLDAEPAIIQQPIANLPAQVCPQHLAYVIYTSGSTGQPKGVAIEHCNTVAFINWAKDFFTAAQLQGVLASTSLCFDLSVFELFVTLSCGGTVILAQDALQLEHLPAKEKVTLINTVPSAIVALIHRKSIPTSVTTVNLAGEPLPNSVVQQLYQLPQIEKVFNLYGPSEDTTYSTVALVPRGVDAPPLIGQPIAQTQIYLVETPASRKDDPLRIVPIGTPGEIHIAGAGLARGYLNRPELTAEKFVANPFSSDPASRLYKTGDLAVYLPDGNLKYFGRIDNQVKIRGFRVELGDVEAALHQFPLVREAAVVAKADTSGNKQLVAYIVPAPPESIDLDGVTIDSSQQDSEQLQQWQKVWSATYSQVAEATETSFDSAGWIDSFTGLPMPPQEVEEWVNCTAARILALHPQRVLEIGCGRGMLLDRIAPHCRRYVGLDLSSEAVQTIETRLQQRGSSWSHVSVAQAMAHQLEAVSSESFDTIILNSVIQYFPGVDYLLQVLEKAADSIEATGQIFVGDVRSLPLLEAFHTGVQINQTPDHISCERLRQRIDNRITHEKELVLHPDFFLALKQQIPCITHVQTQLKRGHSNDELTRFRSDVTLHINKPVRHIAHPICLDWQEQKLSLSKLYDFLQANQPKSVKVERISNARFAEAVEAIELLRHESCATVGELKQQLQTATTDRIHPECFWNLDLPYKVDVTWSNDNHSGDYDVIFQHQSLFNSDSGASDHLLTSAKPPIALKPWNHYSNTPWHPDHSNCLPQLRAFLKQKLPDYMLPTAFVVMDELPLTLNGKIDRRSLPDPKKERPLLSATYTAPSTPLQQQLAQIWSQVLDIEQIGIYDNFFELGGHSLLTVQLMGQIETALQIELPLFYLLQEPTIAGLEKAIERLYEETPAVQQPAMDWGAEITLDPAIQPVAQTARNAEPKCIFLTGATGFLGAFLLQELLQQTQAQIFCLVRAASLAAGQQKLQTTLEQYQIWQEGFDARIVPVLGDLAQPLLGMDAAYFQELAAQLDLIYHCGAAVNLVYPYSALKATNVLGTQEILRLASQGKVTPVHYISTIDVLKPLIKSQQTVKSQQTLVQEDESCNNAELIDKGYTQTKWVAEQLIQAAQQQGIPACVYRPGMLTGHSQTGVSNPNDLMSRLIQGIIQLDAAPDLNHMLNITPIDYASKAIVHLSLQADWSQAFHILHPEAVPWNEFIEQIRRCGYSIRSVSYQAWQAELRQLPNATENILKPILPLFIDRSSGDQLTYLETFLLTAESFSLKNTQSGLAQTSFACPPIDTELLNRYLTFFQKSGFLKLNKVHGSTSISSEQRHDHMKRGCRVQDNQFEVAPKNFHSDETHHPQLV